MVHAWIEAGAQTRCKPNRTVKGGESESRQPQSAASSVRRECTCCLGQPTRHLVITERISRAPLASGASRHRIIVKTKMAVLVGRATKCFQPYPLPTVLRRPRENRAPIVHGTS